MFRDDRGYVKAGAGAIAAAEPLIVSPGIPKLHRRHCTPRKRIRITTTTRARRIGARSHPRRACTHGLFRPLATFVLVAKLRVFRARAKVFRSNPRGAALSALEQAYHARLLDRSGENRWS